MWNLFALAIFIIVIIRLGLIWVGEGDGSYKISKMKSWLIGLGMIIFAWMVFNFIWGQGASLRLGNGGQLQGTTNETNGNDDGNTIIVGPNDDP